MAGTDSKTFIRNLYAEMAKGDPQPFLDALADDVSWTLIGNTRFSGTYRGKPEVLEKFLVPVMNDVDGHMEITPQSFIADGDLVAMQALGKARTKYGKPYNNTYCHVFRVVGGKIREVTEYCDTELVTEAFRA